MSDGRNRGGRPPRRELVDGRMMTTAEFAAAEGISYVWVRKLLSNRGPGATFQDIADDYRAGRIQRRPRGKYGRGLTVRDICRIYGVTKSAVYMWMQRNGADIWAAREFYARRREKDKILKIIMEG